MKPLCTIGFAKCLLLLGAIVLFLSMRFTRQLVGLTSGHWLYYGTTCYTLILIYIDPLERMLQVKTISKKKSLLTSPLSQLGTILKNTISAKYIILLNNSIMLTTLFFERERERERARTLSQKGHFYYWLCVTVSTFNSVTTQLLRFFFVCLFVCLFGEEQNYFCLEFFKGQDSLFWIKLVN